MDIGYAVCPRELLNDQAACGKLLFVRMRMIFDCVVKAVTKEVKSMHGHTCSADDIYNTAWLQPYIVKSPAVGYCGLKLRAPPVRKKKERKKKRKKKKKERKKQKKKKVERREGGEKRSSDPSLDNLCAITPYSRFVPIRTLKTPGIGYY